MRKINWLSVLLCSVFMSANASGAWSVIKEGGFATSLDVNEKVAGLVTSIEGGGYAFGMRVTASTCDTSFEGKNMLLFVNKERVWFNVNCNSKHITFTPVSDLDNDKVINVFKKERFIMIGEDENNYLMFDGDGFTQTLNSL
ncbi:hypothetical protein [Vibrio rotiferianus]|uniref:hypothetical protein n=1 Tax=Vibrio rotiferianus TaxID=190895 RepID=UPI0024920213|nr:hypothetical protein [Vibrio rotiferianus]